MTSQYSKKSFLGKSFRKLPESCPLSLPIWVNSDYFLFSSIKVIVNSTEWEITVHLHEFDESWMRYTIGRVSDIEFKFSLCHFHYVNRSVELL